MGGALRWLALQGRYVLIAGIVAGLLSEALAQVLRPYIPQMVAGLVFLSAFRIGPARLKASFADWPRSLATVLALQLALPLGALVVFGTLGMLDNLFVLALLIICMGPSISGGPNMVAMIGCDPTAAMRTMVLGTALVPLTVLPVLSFLPVFGDIGAVLIAALKLSGVIAASGVAAFALRRVIPEPDPQIIDGASALLQVVIVIGLMSAVRPAIVGEFAVFATWMAFVFVVNFGFQALAFRVAVREDPDSRVGLALIAGNRNIALFLVALPETVTAPLLIFIGCYQIPMYLTPLVLGRLIEGKSR